MDNQKIIKNAVILGYECNQSCIFCYVKDKQGKYEAMTTAQAKEEIREGRKRGAEFLDLVGGEPTIRDDIIKLISYAKKTGYDQIGFTTNGQMLSYEDFAEKVVKAGLNHIIFSIHGPNPEIHDFHTRVEGSFKRLIEGFKNIKKMGEKYEKDIYKCCNTVMTKYNIDHIPEIVGKVGKLGFDKIEVIFPHPKGRAKSNFEEIVPSLRQVEAIVEDSIKKGIENGLNDQCKFRYVPMCIMKGHIDHVDEYKTPVKEQHIGPEFKDLNVEKGREEVGRTKVEKCKECEYNDICEGIWKEYTEKRGTDELKPIS